MKLLLPSSVSSEQDLIGLTLELQAYAKWFSHNAVKERVHAKHTTQPPALSRGALELLRSSTAQKLLSQRDLDELLVLLSQCQKTARTITITLAAPASADLKESLVGWCRTAISPSILVSFKFNSTLLGGMVVRYGSHLFDWSFRRQLLANRAAFPEVLRRV